MDIHRVRYFQVFAESGSILRASEILGISQPALSKALRLLEQEVKLKLMEPDGRGLRLTPAGQKFRRETAPLLVQWMCVAERIQKETRAQLHRLGSFEVFTTHFLSRLLPSIDKEQLQLYELTPGRLEEAILAEKIDVGVTYSPIPKAGLEFIEVTKITMGIFGLKKFQDDKHTELPFAIPLTPNEGIPSKVMGLDGWPDHRFPRRIQYQVTMMESALELAREGQCVAYLPKFVVDLHNEKVKASFQLVELACPVPMKDRKQSVFVVRRSQDEESKFFKAVARALRELE